MLSIHMAVLAGILLFLIPMIHFTKDNNSRKTDSFSSFAPILLFALALFLRLFAASISKGFDNDTACFAAWADRMFLVGPSRFYSPDVFSDYPPGYLYILWFIGALRNILGIEYYSAAHLLLLKLPSILCDLAIGYVLYRLLQKKATCLNAFTFTGVYLFNPAVLLNSSVWGQIDSVYTLLWLLICLCLMNEKLYPTYFLFCIGILIKPQMLLIAPVLLVGILDTVFLNSFRITKLAKNLAVGIAAIGSALVLVLPFGLTTVFNQYFSTVQSYPYCAINACNLWGGLGLNWISQEKTFLGIQAAHYGYAAILIAFLCVLWFGIKHKTSRHKYPLMAAFFMVSVYLFSVRMHERYLYPAVIMLLFAAILADSKRLYISYCLFSLLHFYNTAHSLFLYDPSNYDRKSPFILLVSFGMLAAFIYFICAIKQLSSESDLKANDLHNTSTDLMRSLFSPLPPMTSDEGKLIGKIDLMIMLIVTIFYSIFALYDLGNKEAPETVYHVAYQDTLAFHFPQNSPVTQMAYYIAPAHKRNFSTTLNAEQADTSVVTLDRVFTWQTMDIFLQDDSTFILQCMDSSADILELIFLDASGNICLPENASTYPELFDEQKKYPLVSTFRDSMYFDEIYHARTAYEFIHQLRSYENTHPPLGKIFISLGVLIFGMNPFGWRIVGTVFGIVMVPCIYLFAKTMFKSTPAASLACVLYTFDFMHFTQTRIATIDVYITFFVILMYWMMYRYSRLSYYDTKLCNTFLPLGACGIFMGLGIACKWTGVYAGLGLAIIFFAVLLRRYREYLYAKQKPKGNTPGISHKKIIACFASNTLKTIAFCIVFFVLIPGIIYLLSYLPFRDGSNDGLITQLLHNQNSMLSYHSNLNSTHPYSSSWYAWPIMKRPIWYYSKILTGVSGEGGLREGISAFGNPLVWWLGIPAALYLLFLAITKKDRKAGFLLIGYLAQYLPWFFVTRITFIYHYFPSVVFVVLMIVYCMSKAETKLSKGQYLTLIITYGIAAVALFLMFYPVLSGHPVEAEYVNKFLRWFDSWVLAAR